MAAEDERASGLAAAAGAVVSALPADPLVAKIAALKREQEEVKRRKLELRKQMKNATRSQARLRKRARLMTDEDLVAVLLMRKTAKEAAAAKGTNVARAAKATAGASGAASASGPAEPTAGSPERAGEASCDEAPEERGRESE